MDPIEEEINTLKSTIASAEDTDPKYLHGQMRELRHAVLYVHMKLESFIDIAISHHLFGKYTKNVMESAVEFLRLEPIIEDIDYTKKVMAALKVGAITEEQKSMFMRVNDYRKWFSHQKRYQAELDKIHRDRNEYKKALDILNNALLDMYHLHYETES